jgi:hypothetical protein
MANLDKLQKRLNKDAKLRQAFVENPAKVLAKEEGIKLSKQNEKHLKGMISQLKKTSRKVAGNNHFQVLVTADHRKPPPKSK